MNYEPIPVDDPLIEEIKAYRTLWGEDMPAYVIVYRGGVRLAALIVFANRDEFLQLLFVVRQCIGIDELVLASDGRIAKAVVAKGEDLPEFTPGSLDATNSSTIVNVVHMRASETPRWQMLEYRYRNGSLHWRKPVLPFESGAGELGGIIAENVKRILSVETNANVFNAFEVEVAERGLEQAAKPALAMICAKFPFRVDLVHMVML